MISGGLTLMAQDGFAVRMSYLQVFIMILTMVLMVGFTFLIEKTSLGR